MPQKVLLRLKQHRTAKKIKPVSLAIAKLYLSEDISQAVSQAQTVRLLVSQLKILLNIFLKILSNFLKMFRIDLKAFWA